VLASRPSGKVQRNLYVVSEMADDPSLFAFNVAIPPEFQVDEE
jgi:hypothetical protein